MCAKCNMAYDAVELTWVTANGKTKLLCDKCAKKKQ